MPLGDTELTEKIDDFIVDLKQGKQFSSYDVAYKTVQLLRILISTAKWAHASELIQILKREGRRMMDAERSEVIVGNMVSHVCLLNHDIAVVVTQTSSRTFPVKNFNTFSTFSCNFHCADNNCWTANIP